MAGGNSGSVICDTEDVVPVTKVLFDADRADLPVGFDGLNGIVDKIFQHGHEFVVLLGHKVVRASELQLDMDIFRLQHMVGGVFKDL